MRNVAIKKFLIGKGQPLALMCGPCMIESEDLCFRVAEHVKEICHSLNINYIFKSSFDKANRSSGDAQRGPGLEEGLRILENVKKAFDLPVVTDIHLPEQAAPVAQVCDLIQIPAFLCRQTDILVAAAETGKAVSIKKGQFMAPWDMGNVVEKVRSAGNDNIILVDRGVSFGYNNLVSDMRAIPIMQRFEVPVCFDATHSVQLPGGLGTSSGGQREFVEVLARSAIAAGANCLFMEAHPDPKNALSDAASQIALSDLKTMLKTLRRLYDIVND